MAAGVGVDVGNSGDRRPRDGGASAVQGRVRPESGDKRRQWGATARGAGRLHRGALRVLLPAFPEVEPAAGRRLSHVMHAARSRSTQLQRSLARSLAAEVADGTLA